MLITIVVLIVLNIYCSSISKSIYSSSKKNSMVEVCNIAAGNIGELEVLNRSTILAAVNGLGDPATTRMIITSADCRAMADTEEAGSLETKYIFYPEVVTALEGNDVFRWVYRNGVVHAYAATPIYSYGELIGCVYMTEYDAQQGRIIRSLQGTILTITVLLEIAVIVCALIFTNAYATRFRKVMRSIRYVKDGDYSHKLSLNGRDELNILTYEFNELIDRLQTSEKKRNRFVSDASHELKTPLAAIKLLSDSILQNAMDPDTVREFVGDIGNEADRLNRMSQKLLTLSRIDDRPESATEFTPVAPTIEKVVRMLSPAIDEKKLDVQLALENDSILAIQSDDLYQIIFNLVENGTKYNSIGGILKITLSREADTACISITDTGMGIPEESVGHIFERFYRVDKARVRSTGGSGLGLSIVRNLVKRNGGTITVDSKVGSGTTFTLRFPVKEGETL